MTKTHAVTNFRSFLKAKKGKTFFMFKFLKRFRDPDSKTTKVLKLFSLLKNNGNNLFKFMTASTFVRVKMSQNQFLPVSFAGVHCT